MKPVSCPSLLCKARRQHRRERARNPGLPALVHAVGEIALVNGALYAVLTAVTGEPVVYRFTPSFCWRQRNATTVEVKRLGVAVVAEESAPTLEAELRAALDTALGKLAELELRAHAAAHGPDAGSSDSVSSRKGNGGGYGSGAVQHDHATG
jgi:hypothetical protein